MLWKLILTKDVFWHENSKLDNFNTTSLLENSKFPMQSWVLIKQLLARKFKYQKWFETQFKTIFGITIQIPRFFPSTKSVLPHCVHLIIINYVLSTCFRSRFLKLPALFLSFPNYNRSCGVFHLDNKMHFVFLSVLQ